MNSRHTPLIALVFLAFLGRPCAAADPRDEVLRLVPEDVGFCLLVQDLRGHAKAFLESPFLARLSASPLGARIAQAPEIVTLCQVRANLERSLGITLAQLRDEVLGDAVVLAYRPGPVHKPDDEAGLFALRARDAKLLAQAMDRINQLQRQAGQLKDLQSRAYRGFTYHRRVLATGANYYVLHDGLFVFATQEGILREALDRAQTAEPVGASLVSRFQQLGLANRFLALWVNPRAFEPALRERAREADGLKAVALRTFLDYWQTLDGIALSVAVEKDLEVALTIRAKKERLPAATRRFLETAAVPSDLWQSFPPDAILTMAGRFDVFAFAEMMTDFIPERARALVRLAMDQWLGFVFNRDLLGKILPQLGPDWGVCLLPPPPGSKGLLPQLLIALRVRRDLKESSAEQELGRAVLAYADLLVKAFNQLHAATMGLQIIVRDKTEIRFLVEDTVFPPGFRPSFALSGGYLLLASSPQAIERFSSTASRKPPKAGEEVPFARFSPRVLADFIKSRSEPLCSYLALIHQLSSREIRQRLESLLAVLEMVDMVEVVKRSSAEQMSLILRVRPQSSFR